MSQPVNDIALQLERGRNSEASIRVAKALQFFGLPARAVSWTGSWTGLLQPAEKVRLICSASLFSELMEKLETDERARQSWEQQVHSALVYSEEEGSGQRLLERLAPGPKPASGWAPGAKDAWSITAHYSEFCGPLSGLVIPSQPEELEAALSFSPAQEGVQPILYSAERAGLLKAVYRSVPVFLWASGRLIDLDAELPAGNFDIREHVSAALPLAMYLKWAFPRNGWRGAGVKACLVIDDPLLQPRYGFLRFAELLELMKKHRFSTNIAFIPWNWRRSDREVIRQFRQNPERYSLSVHGCDHTGGEFGIRDRARLDFKTRQALERMSRHQAATGIEHASIMVFPQGVFSAAAMSVLKRNNFVAAVNTEVVTVDPDPAPIRVSDAWDVAVMRYDDFPLFTRRYPAQGVENFAFDILLGKPCIIVTHHDFCSQQYQHLVSFVDRLNRLNNPPAWCGLGELVRTSCRWREQGEDAIEIEMYGNELRLENQGEKAKRFLVSKQERDESLVASVHEAGQPRSWTVSDGRLFFETELQPGEHRAVRVLYHPLEVPRTCSESVKYRVKTGLRRYLSEVRDNYLTPTRSWFAGLSK